MFRDSRSEEENNESKLGMVGYDLTPRYVQISYMIGTMEDPETASTVTGSEIYNIPLVLCKRPGVNQWSFGRDALKMAEARGGILVDRLLERAVLGDMVELDGEQYDPVALLTLFVKRSLSVLGMVMTPDRIGSLMFSVEDLNDRMVEILGRVGANLSLKRATIHFQSYQESLYYFMLHQPKELWSQKVLICNYDGMRLHHYVMERNVRTTPIVVLMKDAIVETLVLPVKAELPEGTEASEPDSAQRDNYAQADLDFYRIMERVIGEDVFSCVYLLGDGFKENWMKQSLRFLCRGRKGFKGNNLLSRGACYSLKDRRDPSETVKQHVYLGKEKLISNIGIQVVRRGDPSYFVLLDAGQNWFDSAKECEFFLPEDGKLEILITPVDGREPICETAILEELPDRPSQTTRVRLHATMLSVKLLQIRISDLGFGELYPSTGREWIFEYTIG